MARKANNTVEMLAPTTKTAEEVAKAVSEQGTPVTADDIKDIVADINQSVEVSTFDVAMKDFEAKHSLPLKAKEVYAQVTKDAFAYFASQAENELAFGNSLLKLAEDRPAKEVYDFLFMLEIKGYLSMQRAKRIMAKAQVISQRIKHPLVRKWACTIGDGAAIVIQRDATEEELSIAPKVKRVWDLSPYIITAMESFDLPKGKLDDDGAEMYWRKVITLSRRLRGKSQRGARLPEGSPEAIAAEQAATRKRHDVALKSVNDFVDNHAREDGVKIVSETFLHFLSVNDDVAVVSNLMYEIFTAYATKFRIDGDLTSRVQTVLHNRKQVAPASKTA